MTSRFVSIWFRHLTTDWFTLRQLAIEKGAGERSLKHVPFVLRAPSHGRMVIAAANAMARQKGLASGMVLADARAIIPELEVLDDKPDLAGKLLKRLAEWCIRFSPVVAIDPPDGLFLDVTGCTHLWRGDRPYLKEITKRLNARGYDVRAAIADTAGVAWGVARFGKPHPDFARRFVVAGPPSTAQDRGGKEQDEEPLVIPIGMHVEALMGLPPEALRLEGDAVDRLHKLGLHQIGQFMRMPRSSLRRRFGQHFVMRLDMAIGQEIEAITPVLPPEPYQERLSCLDPIVTASGIAIALQQLLEALCLRLKHEQKGLRAAVFKGYRVDGKVEKVEIGTHRPSHHVHHLFKLFELKLATIEPALGIELFILEAPKVEDHYSQQEKIWEGSGGLEDIRLSELIDRLAGKIGTQAIRRYVPDEHYWPERSFKTALSLQEELSTSWRTDILRPLWLLATPENIEVTAPIPDYPPMLFRYKGQLHSIVKADGPERIEQEWWLQQGQHRDYYRVEDADGHRYWIFRLGHYHDETYQWFIHGVFS